jgi:UDP-3-O-[3-hydroxymyristoyl] N-acetylglucosamine deacetylase/3-hydroxyacyl-[acyl-carrier-protein] dehydratase
VALDGTGVHSGEAARLTFHPAEPDTGVVFRRVDLDGCPHVPADIDHVVGTELGTTIGVGETRVLTIEHVMAALAGLQIDNVRVDLSGPEIPIRDGSFQDYCSALEEAGILEQEAEAKVFSLVEPVQAQGNSGSSYVAAPASGGLRVSATIDFENPVIGRSYGSFPLDPAAFRTQIAPARTFGFMADAEALHARGLALGASLDNAVVIGEDGIMNDELRFDDEFLRHKVGDVLGDLALLGGRIDAHVVADRPSHEGNLALARAIRTHVRRSGPPVADVTRIMEFMPHRFPMLLVDRIIDFQAGESIVGLKNVTINEPFFQGHFPGHPIMPGVLLVEAMAQCGGLLLMDQVENPEDKVVYFMTMDNVKFRQPVTPGDTVVFELHVVQFRRQICRMAGRGLVDGTVVAEAEFKARIMDK